MLPESIRQRVGPAGGRLASPDGRVALEIAPGGFAQAVDVELAEIDITGSVDVGGGRWVKAVRHLRLEARLPDGRAHPMPFALPVTLTLRYVWTDVIGCRSERFALHTRPTPADPWVEVPVVVDRRARTVTVRVSHFSENLFTAEVDAAVLPSVAGYQTDLFNGAATVAIPLTVPPGTNQMAPELVLRYSSAGPGEVISDDHTTYQRAQGSWVGFGWTLDVGYIETGGVGHVLVLGGRSYQVVMARDPSGANALSAPDGATIHRTQAESFLQIREYSRVEGGIGYHYFVVRARDGTEYRFGHEPNTGDYIADGSRVDHRARDANCTVTHDVRRYCLDGITDPHGNAIDIAYQAFNATQPNDMGGTCPLVTLNNDRSVYPVQILYTSTDGGGPKRKVELVLADRTDTPVGMPWDGFYETKKLDRVRVWTADAGGVWSLRREYRFAYDQLNLTVGTNEPGGQLLVLRSVTEADGAGTTRPATEFTYATYPAWTPAGGTWRCPLPLLTRVDNRQGGLVDYAYESFDVKDWGAPQATKTRRWTVQTKTVQDGVGGSFTTTFGRQGAAWTSKFLPNGVWQYPDFRGFAVSIVTEPTGHYHEHRFYQGLANPADRTINPNGDSPPAGLDLVDREEFKGQEYKVAQVDADGPVVGVAWRTCVSAGSVDYKPNYLRELTNEERRDWSVHTVFPGETRVRRGTRSNRTVFGFDPAFQNGGQYGNLTDVDEYLDVNDARSYRHTRRWFYPTDRNERYMVDRVAQEDVYEVDATTGAWTWRRSTGFLYDRSPTDQSTNNAQPVGTNDDLSLRGFLTGVRRRVTLNGQWMYADQRFERDAYGNRSRETAWAGYGTGSAWASDGPRATTTVFGGPHNSFATQVTNALGQVEERAFDLMTGKPTWVKDANNQETALGYDGFGRLVSVLGPWVGDPTTGHRKQLAFTHDLPWTANGKTTTRVAIGQNTGTGPTPVWSSTFRFYDGRGQAIQEYRDWPGGHNLVNRRFDGRGLLVVETAPRVPGVQNGLFNDGDWLGLDTQPKTQTTYDALKRVRSVTGPDGLVTATTYPDWHREVVDPKGHKKRFEQDGLGRPTAVREYVGIGTGGDPYAEYAVTGYGFDVLGNLRSVVDALGNTTTITVDELGRKTAMTDPDMGSWSYVFDGRGNLIRQTDARGVAVDFRYDRLDRLVSVWHPVAWTEPITYPGSGLPGQTRPSVHDLMELRAAVDAEYAAAGRTDFGSWEDDVLLSGRPPVIRARHFNQIKERISALRVAVGLSTLPDVVGDWPLDASKHIRAQHPNDLRGWLTQYESDVAAVNPNDPDPLRRGPALRARAVWGYDGAPTGWGVANAVGRRAWACDGSGRWLWSYDAYGRMVLEARRTDGVAYDTGWTFDAYDRPRTLTLPADPPPSGPIETLTFGYGPHLLLTDLTSSIGNTALLWGATYNALGLPTGWTVGGVATASLGYWGLDAAGSPYGALNTQRLQKAGVAALIDRALTYDPAGNVVRLVDNTTGETFDYGSDFLDRLTSVSGSLAESYGFDPIGNLTTKAGVSQHYPGAGEAGPRHAPVWVGSPADALAYDPNGNLLSRGAKALQYDPRNRLTKVAVGGQTVARYTHDGDGVRTKRLDQNGTVHSVRRRYERNVGNGGALPDVGTKYYETQLGTRRVLVAFRRGGQLFYAGIDHLGGTVKVADGGLNAVDGTRYRPWGEQRDPGTNLGTDRKFTGQTWDEVTGLYWFQSRYYDPSIGRFVQPDTLVPDPANPQALNRYAYGLNNPLRYGDPSGHVAADPEREGALQLTKDDFDAMNWGERGAWLDRFTERYGLGDWFNDIKGAIGYFTNSPDLRNSKPLLDADAVILQVIQDGLAAYRNNAQSGPSGTQSPHDQAAQTWTAFFAGERSGVPDRQLVPMRAAAEQAGVNYGVTLGLSAHFGAGTQGAVEEGFVRGADQYRSWVMQGTPVLDPRGNPGIYAFFAGAGEGLVVVVYGFTITEYSVGSALSGRDLGSPLWGPP